MTLNDLKYGVFSEFFAISTAAHILRLNCAEMVGDGPTLIAKMAGPLLSRVT